MYVDDSDPIVVSSQMSYGDYKMNAKAGKTYQLQIYNWKDATVNGDFLLHTYAEKSPVPFVKS